jgi:hypothetical protein
MNKKLSFKPKMGLKIDTKKIEEETLSQCKRARVNERDEKAELVNELNGYIDKSNDDKYMFILNVFRFLQSYRPKYSSDDKDKELRGKIESIINAMDEIYIENIPPKYEKIKTGVKNKFDAIKYGFNNNTFGGRKYNKSRKNKKSKRKTTKKYRRN